MTARECAICEARTPRDIIGESAECWVTAATEAPLPGYVCVVSKTHAVEPFDLPSEQQVAFWLDVCAVARSVRAALDSPKINYEIHGNTIPHLHLHLFPRYPDDPYTARPIDGSSRAFHRSGQELALLADAVQQALR